MYAYRNKEFSGGTMQRKAEPLTVVGVLLLAFVVSAAWPIQAQEKK
jgi:hypothetical protein